MLASIAHREPDKVPVDIGGTPSSSISAIAYNNLANYCNFSDKTNNIYDIVEQVTQPSDEFIDRFNIDVIDVGRTFNKSSDDCYEITLSNGTKANYPNWFHPENQENGEYFAYNEKCELLANIL